MFDKVLAKTEEAMSQLNKTLSTFEQDASRLKAKFEEQLAGYYKRMDEERRILSALTTDETGRLQKDLELLLSDHKRKLSELFDIHKSNLKAEIEADLETFTQTVKSRFEGTYAEHEAQVVERAKASFEGDLSALFKVYGDRLAPHLFKALVRYVFRLGRKSH